MSLAQRTLSGFIWTLASRLGTRLSIFVVGVILARLLTPADFGLVAMLGIFFAVSSSLVDSGFTTALIREKVISETDKNTVFNINLIVSIIMYLALWIGSPIIARFFNQPQLLWLTRIMGLDIIFKALCIVQRAVLMHSLKFKLLSAIDVGVSILTGVIAIYMAYTGLGVWALAIKYFLSSLFIFILFFWLNPWKPSGFINRDSFNRLFGFGSKLLLTGLLNTIYSNIYNLVIGKFFSPAILGFYNRAYSFTSQTISTVLIALQQVTYPILSKTQDNAKRLKSAYRKIIIAITFINFPLTTMLAFTAKPLILLLLGEKWIDTVPYLQLLCISALVTHLSSINQNLFKVIGRSDIFLKISVITKIFTSVAIIIGFQFGIWGLVIGSIISQYFEVFLGMYYSSKQIDYPLSEQFKDIVPVGILLLPLLLVMLAMTHLNLKSDLLTLLIMVILGGGAYLLSAFLSKSLALSQINELILPYIKDKKNMIRSK